VLARDHLPTELLETLTASIDEVEETVRRAAGAAYGHGSDLAVLQFSESAADVTGIGRLFVSAQRDAAVATLEWAETIDRVSPGAGEWVIISDEQWPELGQLRVLWKAWFFVVRALCDHVYRLLLAQTESRAALRGGSMGGALKTPANPVAIILAEAAPDFLAWFGAYRDRRNVVKEGVALTCTALHSPGVAITFDEYRIDPTTGRHSRLVDSDRHRVTLADVQEDVRQLIAVLTIVADRYA